MFCGICTGRAAGGSAVARLDVVGRGQHAPLKVADGDHRVQRAVELFRSHAHGQPRARLGLEAEYVAVARFGDPAIDRHGQGDLAGLAGLSLGSFSATSGWSPRAKSAGANKRALTVSRR